MTKKDEKKKNVNMKNPDVDMQKLGESELNEVAGGGFYEDHFVYDEAKSHSKVKKGLLAATAWNGGSR